jgi:hypothetical protein
VADLADAAGSVCVQEGFCGEEGSDGGGDLESGDEAGFCFGGGPSLLPLVVKVAD